MHEKVKKRDHTKRRNHPGGQRLSEEEVLSEKRGFRREWREFLSREIGENEKKNYIDPFYRNLSFSMDREVSKAVKNKNFHN